MRTGFFIVLLMGVGVFAASAIAFDSGTLAFIGAAMLVVVFFAGAAVTLGVLSRARAAGPDRAPEDAEVIRDEQRGT